MQIAEPRGSASVFTSAAGHASSDPNIAGNKGRGSDGLPFRAAVADAGPQCEALAHQSNYAEAEHTSMYTSLGHVSE